MGPQNEDMDADRLASITADAVSNVLFFHTKHITTRKRPPADIRRAGIDNAINAVFHLRSQAADIAVAHLEIACDAALNYAHEYNELHPDDIVIPYWMYICVQALLSPHLRPALLEGGKVERLLDWVAEQTGELAQVQPSDPGLDEGPTMSSVDLPTSSSQQSSYLDVSITSDDDEVSSCVRSVNAGEPCKGGPMRPLPKMPWTEADICQLIELRAQGLTHMETAARLDRGQGAVENKYGRVVKEAAWKPYVAECAARFMKVRRGKRKLRSKLDQKEVEENEEEDEEEERRAVVKKRKKTLAAAAGLE
ncbi:hypothetical protein N0V82_000405 [Gnomoniopsis sp. IMI 355080]|nr:hypothetical protein N0V82_000405 [Gnomoniopsis sp. IMI 355080]